MKVKDLLLEFSEKKLDKEIKDVYLAQFNIFNDVSKKSKDKKALVDQAKLAYNAISKTLNKYDLTPSMLDDYVDGTIVSDFIKKLTNINKPQKLMA